MGGGLLIMGRRKKREMKRRILLVDDEVAVLLTLKAVLEIAGFEVETAASGKEGKLKLRSHEYDMVITDMRMESDEAGAEMIAAARAASCQPAVALLTAFPLAEEDWQEMGADHMLVKPMQTRILLQQIDRLMEKNIARRGDGLDLTAPAKGKKASAAKKAVKAGAKKVSKKAVGA